MTDTAAQAAADQLAAQLEALALALRLGRVPHWAVTSCAGPIRMVAHVLCGPRGRYCNVTELAPWATPGNGHETASHLLELGSLKKG